MSKRFAFYGRVSTEDQQDPESSKQWQLARSRALIEPHGGEIVTEFFDVGLSRSLPWKRREEAAALLQTFRERDRGFNAVVIGEPARAFYGNQFGLTFPVFEHYGVELWVPEVGGRIDPGSDAHELVMTMYGGMSKGERNRIKIRVKTSMKAQASTQGRYLGGRPPYGYLLADAGPHPNPGKASAGQRAHRLEVDPTAAPVVQRIYREYLQGRGTASIANRLTREGVPCPSAHDPARNRHRSGAAWVASAIEAILRNPRYTGYEVWNKQRKEEVLIDVEDVALGHQSRMRWNAREKWIISPSKRHEAIIDEADFDLAQSALKDRGHQDVSQRTVRAPRRSTRPYLFRGVITCGRCQRHMEGSWNNGRAHYRCKLKLADRALAEAGHPSTVYVREDKILPHLDAWLDQLFSPTRCHQTVDLLREGSRVSGIESRRESLKKLQACDGKIRRYREALEAGADPSMVAQWTSEVVAEQARLTVALRDLEPANELSKKELLQVVEELGGLSQALKKAEPRDRADLYLQLGLHLCYEQDNRLIRATIIPEACTTLRVRGGT
ncbi:recombinase family protein [Kineosporia babensis]|uniref:Recombinase family protein n=1 Tax=Kineosporia babensis TaxID=499548 RepID=A0A9X1STL2_9ACTN|nr:recombinase family protein [Kineosporia babensis]